MSRLPPASGLRWSARRDEESHSSRTEHVEGLRLPPLSQRHWTCLRSFGPSHHSKCQQKCPISRPTDFEWLVRRGAGNLGLETVGTELRILSRGQTGRRSRSCP